MKKGIVLFLLSLAAVTAGLPASNGLKESIFVHIDRDVYISGDNLYFKVYLYGLIPGKLSDKSKIAYILLYDSNNTQVFHQCLRLSGGMGNSRLYLPDTLKTGHYLFIAYTNRMRNSGDSSFFRKELLIANRFDPGAGEVPAGGIATETCMPANENNAIKVQPGKVKYHTREKVSLQLSVASNIQATVSVSVSEKSPGQGSYLPGGNGHPLHSFEVNSLAGTRDSINYHTEDKGYIIGGTVSNPASVSGIPVILSTADSIPNIAYAFSDSKGRFYFLLDEYYYNRELFIQIADPETARKSVLTLDNKFDCNVSFEPPDNHNPAAFTNFLQKSQKIAKINKTYFPRTVNNEISGDLAPLKKRVYYKPDMKIFMADFVPLNNFYEIVRETLPGARIRKNGTDYLIEIVDMESKVYMDDPALFINGILVNNLNSIIQFGSDKVVSVELVFHKRAYGPLLFNGIVSIITRDVKNDVFPANPHLKIQPVRFLSGGSYRAFEYSTPEKLAGRTPDFRQLLYWEPSVFIEKEKSRLIEFYTSDNTGTYSIQIEGIASDGKRIHVVSCFDVLNRSDNL